MNFIIQINAGFLYSLLLLIVLNFNEFVSACDCPGAEATVSGHSFCFEIQRSSNASWADADQKCLSLGGFLAHLDSSSLINNIKSYVQSSYQRPLLTGGLLGNAEYQLIALMCPNNTFMSLLNTTIASDIINGNASSTSGSCLFLQNSDYKLHYDNCNSTFDILCQIPMNDTQTCGVMMQCNSNNGSSVLSTSNTATQSSIRNSSSSSNNNSQNSGPNNNSQNSGSNNNAQNSGSINNAQNSGSSNNSQNPSSSRPIFSSTIAAISNLLMASSSNQLNNPSTLIPNNASTANNSTAPLIATQDSNIEDPNHDVSPRSTMSQISTNSEGNFSVSTPSATISLFLSTILPNSSLISTSKKPSNSTATPWLYGSTVSWATYSSNSSNQCDSGYTKLGKWCLPWWAWLVFGLLLFMVFFTLAICLVCICIGNRKKKVATAENYERLNSGYMAKQNRPSSEPPRSIYDNNNDYLAPAPYSAPNNNAPIYI